MPYRSKRKKRAYYKNLDKVHKSESNRDYYVHNSEKLKARSRSVYKADPSKRQHLQPFTNCSLRRRWSLVRPIIVPIRPRRKPIIVPIRPRRKPIILATR